MNIRYLKFLKKVKELYKNINWSNKNKVREIRNAWIEVKDYPRYSLTSHFFSKNKLLIKMGLTVEGKNLRLNCIDYWTLRGFSEEDARMFVSDHQKNVVSKSLNHYGCSVASKKFLKLKGFDDEEINTLMKNRDRFSFNDLSYDELITISKKGNETRIKHLSELKETDSFAFRSKFNNTIEYYISKGYSIEESKVLLKNRQITFSLEKLKQKFDSETAYELWMDRQQRWQTTINNKSASELEQINQRKAVTLKNLQMKYGSECGEQKYLSIIENRKTHTSKEALTFFDRLLTCIEFDEEAYWCGSLDKSEYFLFDSNSKKFYFYDFTLKNRKIIIEYHGESFHPRKEKLTDNEWKTWKVPFTNESAESKFEFDRQKNNFAKSNGFEVIEVWSSDSFEESLSKIVKLIENKI